MAKKREYWSDEDVEVLKKFYPSLDYKSMFDNFSSTRDIRSIQEKAKRLKIRASKYWTKDQLDEFKKRYPTEGASVLLCEKFKRSKYNLWAIAKTLGLKSLREDKGMSHPIYKGFKEVPKDYFSTTRRSAKKRNLEFLISMEDIYSKFIEQDRKCKYSGREVSFFDKTASVDRIESRIGYISGNIQIVHKYVNLFKLSNSEEVFLNWVKTIYKFNYEV